MKHWFVSTILLAGLALSAGAKGKEKEEHGYPKGVEHHRTIFASGMKKGVAGYRIPAIVTAKNGTLVAAIDERVPNLSDLKYSKDINIAVRLSGNNGRTWSKAKVVVDFPHGQSASDPSLIVDEKTGYIFLFYNFMDLNKEKDVYYFHYVMSKNNGKKWSKPVDITDQISKEDRQGDFQFITSGRGCYTQDGKMLHTLVNLKKGLHIFGSDDHGKTWYVMDAAIRPADESKIIELSDGRWMVNSRVNGRKARTIHISEDKGKSWKTHTDSQLPDPSCNGAIVRYSSKAAGDDKDRLLFCNANSTKGRQNLCLRISYDEGETWSEGKVIYPGLAAYSDMTVLKNGDIAIFFEKDGYKENDVVVVTLDWLTDGEDEVMDIKDKK
ncbi:MAG: sialidase family protein [Akkermansia sp.]